MTDDNSVTVPEPVDEPLAETPMPLTDETTVPEMPAPDMPPPEMPAPDMPVPEAPAPPAPPAEQPVPAPPTPPAYVPPAQPAPGYAPPAGAAPSAPAQKEKVVAGVLAILLGSLGIHKFYLGYKNEGIILLLLTLVGWIAFGLGPAAAQIIGIVEGVIYLTKTDQDFYQTYVANKKAWF